MGGEQPGITMVRGRGIQILGKYVCEGLGFQRHTPHMPINAPTEFCVDTMLCG